MKNRDYKNFAAGQYYHIYNRGNGKMDILRDEADFKFFLYRLKENLFPQLQRAPRLQEGRPRPGRYIRKILPAHAYTLICYCLMPNHFHFLIRQNSDLAISKLISKVCTSYSMYFNRKYEHIGSIFQDRFKSILVTTDSQLLWLSAYLHQNPKVAGVVENLAHYPWSSYLDFIRNRGGTLSDPGVVLGQFSNPEEYKKFVEGSYGEMRKRKDIESLLLD